MNDASRSMTVARLMAIVLGATAATAVLSSTVHAADGSSAPVPSTEGWLVKSYGQIEIPAASKSSRNELAELKAIVAKRTADDIARFRWWATGGPAYRWNEIILEELHDHFVTLPLAARHLALFHAAVDDAVAVAWHNKTAAATVLARLFPRDRDRLLALGKEAAEARIWAGIHYRFDIEAGQDIGRKVAEKTLKRAFAAQPN